MENKELCEKLIALAGGKANIISSTNCYTRLRIPLKDTKLANVEEIKKLPSVLGVVFDSNQMQVVVGPGKAAKLGIEMKSLLESDAPINVNVNPTPNSENVTSKEATMTIDYMATKKKERAKHSGKVNSVIRKVSLIFVPLIPAFIVCGLLTALNDTLGMYVAGYSASTAGKIVGVISGCVFTVLNIVVGYNATKEFGGDGIIGACLAGILANPLLGSVDDPILTFGVIKIYAGLGGVISVLFVAIAAAYFEKLLRKFMPNIIDAFVTPLITLIVMAAAGLFVFMPIGGFISEGFAFIVTQIVEHVPALLGIVPMFYLFLVLTGTHHGLIAINSVLIEKIGVTYLLPVQLMAGAAQVGAAIYVLMKTKNKALKKLTISSTPIGILGIGEPLIWGMSVPLKRPFIAASLGGFAGGTFIACMRLSAKVAEGTGIQAALLINNPLLFIVGYVIAIAAGFLIQFLIGFKDTYEIKDENGALKTITVETSWIAKKYGEYRLKHPKKVSDKPNWFKRKYQAYRLKHPKKK